MSMTTQFNFTLRCKGVQLDDSLLDRLHDSGCDDATFSQRGGWLFAEFSRLRTSVDTAVISAVADLRKAGITVDAILELPAMQEGRKA